MLLQKHSYMLTQSLLHQRPALLQVGLSILGEQRCKTALLQQPSGVVFPRKSRLLPSLWHGEELRFINCYRLMKEKKKKKKDVFVSPLSPMLITPPPRLTTQITERRGAAAAQHRAAHRSWPHGSYRINPL